MGLRVGIDVGGTFTKAAVVDFPSRRVVASASVPTTHSAEHGVSEGVVEALEQALGALASDDSVELVAFSTTQAMNALLEGDVARVGVIGMGEAPDLRVARKRTSVGKVDLAPGHRLELEHAFLDTGAGLQQEEVRAALDRFEGVGVGAVAVSEAFSVDDPKDEAEVVEIARERGLPSCAGHDLVGTYGLETRTVSAAINASILPVIARTAAYVEDAIKRSGLSVPLLVLRGDGGAMDVDGFSRTPVFTLGSGPAAGVAAGLHELEVSEGIVVEVGGTSSNVSVIKGGRPTLRSIRVMGRSTCVRSLDSWVVGAAGGSMARMRKRKVAEVGPRSAHIAGLPYACFAPPNSFADAEFTLVSPRSGDPEAYAALKTNEAVYALTATCAANALGVVEFDDYAYAPAATALSAFEVMGEKLRKPSQKLAKELLYQAAAKIAAAVEEAALHYKLPKEAPIIALGGAAGAIAASVGDMVGRTVVQPEHSEVLSSIGTALSLVRSQVERSAGPELDPLALAHEAELKCVRSGAAANTVSVETVYDSKSGVVRAVATGAVALEAGAISREPLTQQAARAAAGSILNLPAELLKLAAETDFYTVYSENGSGRVAVIDSNGTIVLSTKATDVIRGDAGRVRDQLKAAVERRAISFGIATVPPQVFLVCGPHMLDLSYVKRTEEILTRATRAIKEYPDNPVAIVVR